MVLWLVLVRERRLPIKPAADYLIHGQQISLPANPTVRWASIESCRWWQAGGPVRVRRGDQPAGGAPAHLGQHRRHLPLTRCRVPAAGYRREMAVPGIGQMTRTEQGWWPKAWGLGRPGHWRRRRRCRAAAGLGLLIPAPA
jgi:hypothetical protein